LKIQKKNFLKKFCSFREKRNYLHSTDIFNQIIYFIKNRDIKDLEINFKKKIKNYPYLIILNDSNLKIKKTYCINFNYKKDNIKYYGFIYQSLSKIINKKKYDEQKFQQTIQLTKKSILISTNVDYDFIEKITSGTMKYLNNNNSINLKGKWNLVKLKIRNISQINNRDFIKVTSTKCNENVNFFSIIKKKKIGEMIFLKR
jgi:hypothetical protein